MKHTQQVSELRMDDFYAQKKNNNKQDHYFIFHLLVCIKI